MHELDGDDFASVAGGDDRLISDGMRRLAGAAVFAALVVGLGLWAYRLGTRDATEVPIIRAMEGPARVAPDDPGGLQAAHQGLEVNAVLAGRPAPEPTATAAALPEALAGEDAPQGELVQAAPAALAARVLAEEAGTVAGTDAGSGPVPRDAAVAIVAPADLAPADLSPAAPVDADLTVAALPADPLIGDGAPIAALPADDDGAAEAPSASPRPRPAGLVVSRAKPAAAAPAAKPAAAEAPAVRTASTPAAKPAAPAAAVSTASPRAGSRLVQLGAFDSESSARKAWDQLVARNPDLLSSKQLVAERATSNARVFYRLRVAGFDSSDQTRQMCEALRARGIDCIPVTVQ